MALHLGILQTDSVLQEFQPNHGDYPQMFTNLFEGLGADLRFTTYNVQQSCPPDIVCDAYLITGSRHSVYEELPWIQALVRYLREVLELRKKVIGVCFGHQLMAHYFGGRVASAEAGWAVGVHRSRVLEEQVWMADGARDVALLSSHKDQVIELPTDAQAYLSNDFCPFAGFTVADQVITVQGHPEFHKSYAKVLMDMRQEILGQETYQCGIKSLDQPTDEQVMARWLLDFVMHT
jgi:GMP synthase-like glutamine amidotransferase